MKRNLVFWVAYDGTGYSGWQKQKNSGVITVQGEIMVAQYTELPWIALMLAQFAVGTAVGGLIGTRLLKKHVRKAKIA